MGAISKSKAYAGAAVHQPEVTIKAVCLEPVFIFELHRLYKFKVLIQSDSDGYLTEEKTYRHNEEIDDGLCWIALGEEAFKKHFRKFQ